MILSIALKELRCMLFSPLAWSLAAVLQLLLAWLFLVQLEEFLTLQPQLAQLEQQPGITDLVVMPLLDSTAVLSMLITPLLTMRLISEEFRSGTYRLIAASPATHFQLVMGKYLSLLALFSLLLGLVSLMPLSLLLGGTLDLGRLGAGICGLWLLMASFGAIGLMFSSMTSQPTIAAIGSYGLLLFLWMVNLTGGEAGTGSVFSWIALSTHFHNMLTGLVSTADIAYFLLLIGLCLGLTHRRLDNRRIAG